MLTQVSILLLYKRVFTTIKDWFRITLYVLGAISILTGVALTIALLSKCQPFSYDWTRFSLDTNAAFDNNKGHCIKGIAFAYPTHAIVTLLIDIALVVLPIPTIWNLQMSPGTKRAIGGMFLLGSLSVITLRYQWVSKVTDPLCCLSVAIINIVRLPQLFHVEDSDYTCKNHADQSKTWKRAIETPTLTFIQRDRSPGRHLEPSRAQPRYR